MSLSAKFDENRTGRLGASGVFVAFQRRTEDIPNRLLLIWSRTAKVSPIEAKFTEKLPSAMTDSQKNFRTIWALRLGVVADFALRFY